MCLRTHRQYCCARGRHNRPLLYHALLAAYSVKDQSVQKLSRMETGMDTIDRITFSLTWAVMITTMKNNLFNKLSPRGQRDDMSSADGSSTRGGSTSVRGRVRSPHMAKLQAARVPIA